MESRVSSAITWLYDLRSVLRFAELRRLLPTHSQDKLPSLYLQPRTQTGGGVGTWGLYALGKCPTNAEVEQHLYPKHALRWGVKPQSLISSY